MGQKFAFRSPPPANDEGAGEAIGLEINASRRGGPETSPGVTAHPAEADLILAVGQNQDRLAFANLFGRVAPKINAYLLQHNVPDRMAETLALETMVQVWLQAPGFRPAAINPYAWLFTILRGVRSTTRARPGGPV